MKDAYCTSGSSPGSMCTEPDFLLSDEGSIFLLQPLTPAAVSWIEENISDDHMTFGSAVVVEHRFIADIVRGAIADGLAVRG